MNLPNDKSLKASGPVPCSQRAVSRPPPGETLQMKVKDIH